MGWYLRKSVSLGPVRFNLSKSGIGTSIGVTGFRVGVRPNGSSYLHAGRHGLYYREELRKSNGRGRSNTDTQLDEYFSQTQTEKFETASAKEMVSSSRNELLNKLNKSCESRVEKMFKKIE